MKNDSNHATSRQEVKKIKETGVITKRGVSNIDKIETSSSAAAMKLLEVPLGQKKGTPTLGTSQCLANQAQSVKIQPNTSISALNSSGLALKYGEMSSNWDR